MFNQPEKYKLQVYTGEEYPNITIFSMTYENHIKGYVYKYQEDSQNIWHVAVPMKGLQVILSTPNFKVAVTRLCHDNGITFDDCVLCPDAKELIT